MNYTEQHVAAMAEHLRWIRTPSPARYAARLDYIYQHGHLNSFVSAARAEIETNPDPNLAVRAFVRFARRANSDHDARRRCAGHRRGPHEDACLADVASAPSYPWVDIDGAFRACGAPRWDGSRA